EGHPYAAWLETYRVPAFVTATQGALGHVEREMAAASPTGRAAAARAFLIACRHELEVFEQALRIDTGEDACPRRPSIVPRAVPRCAPGCSATGSTICTSSCR